MKTFSRPTHRYLMIDVLLLFMLAAAGCRQKGLPNRLRLVNAMPVNATLEVRHHKSGKKASGGLAMKVDLGFGMVHAYQDIDRRTYELVCRAEGREVAKQELVLWSGGWYTAVVTGLPVLKDGDERPALRARVKQFFEGEEAVPVNRLLPRWTNLRDHVRGGPKQATIRFANFAPGEGPFTVHTEKKKLTKKLAFPQTGSRMKLETGKHSLRVIQYGREIAAGEVDARAGILYTGIIVGAVSPARAPRLIMLENETRKYNP